MTDDLFTSSPKWNSVSDETKLRLGVDNAEDGEFWLEYNDFVQYFDLVEICHVRFPDSRPGVHQLDDGVRLEVDSFHGEWRDPDTAGGKFASNSSN